MIESSALVREFARLVRGLSGARAVSVALVSPEGDAPPLLVHLDGTPALDALSSPDQVRRLEQTWSNGSRHATGQEPERVEGLDSACVVFRVPVGPVAHRRGDDARGHAERRLLGERRPSEDAVWLALRDLDGDSPILDGRSERVWNELLAFAAAVLRHVRVVGRLLEDPVTRLPTRAGLRTQLEIALETARSGGQPLALLLINPDGFAEINTRHGRKLGDTALAEIAFRLRRRVRASDCLARYGGATFGVLLPGIGRGDAERLAGELRGVLESDPYCNGAIRLNFSCGVVVVDEPEQATGDVDRWIQRADEALFQAKLEGGSRHCLWSAGAEDQPGRTVDRLQGMFTGDFNTDYRHMAMLWELVQAIAEGGPPEELYRSVTVRLHTWLPARLIAFVEPASDREPPARVLAALVDGRRPEPDWRLPEPAWRLIADALDSGAPREERSSADDGAKRDRCAIPLAAGGEPLGCIYFESGEGQAQAELPEARFFAALATQLAVALERARAEAVIREQETRRRELLEVELRELRQAVQAEQMIWASAPMRSMLETVRRIAPTDATVLITGESGTGKEMLARTIHRLSKRSDRSLVVVDCSAISASLIDSELFGHERGAFTGADSRRRGRLAEADGGTLFLDEIGELPLDVQGKLLRFVQERQLTPVGSTRSMTVDARIIAATNIDLTRRVQDGSFREDLYHRLDVVRLHLPPLRERGDDVLRLAQVFLERHSSLHGKSSLRFSRAAERSLLAYEWPGNVRELQNRVMRAVLFAERGPIEPEHLELPATVKSGSGAPHRREASAAAATPDAEPSQRLRVALAGELALAMDSGAMGRPVGKWVEADLVLAADERAGGAVRPARDLLGLPDTTYRRRLAKARCELESDLAVRSPSWGDVRSALEQLVAFPGDAAGRLFEHVEQIVLEAIEEHTGGDPRRGALLLGVTEPTYLKRRERCTRRLVHA